MSRTASAHAGPSLLRLTAVELRKTADTRSGRWLLVAVAATAIAMMPVVLYGAAEEERTLRGIFEASQTGTVLLLPVIGVLSVAGEWSQRTALTTFALVPRRHRVLIAKLAGGAVLAVVLVGYDLLVSLAGRGVGGLLDRTSGSWTLTAGSVGNTTLFALVAVSTGVAYGAVFMNPPLAIVAYFLVPNAWSALLELVPALRGSAEWLSNDEALPDLFEGGVTGAELLHAGTSLSLWLVLPLAIGWIRLSRREVK